ncbi:hypothetical protein Kpol_381p5 [Vanderwaltozyma polyspora DSM 70294]|uniref:Sir1 ORC-binding domain-containing protein n=1 Tax=Vanderwaltozyma polyspora (strain ATCC 22028 / DSM 70294 / BCRC 21397 / CBS 2163 / NBRC 10782 / NRRL Y-8283 / UCD 57-17) TaxID=436907 RepID=A7TSQ3_VANPO|nr:uncharacterized protein Kpol_381p5 [Vanderwaltozyma polyspora DSM 70294]EDO14706.1 hypothetical protein Kpol_381p5 [Vanderwaltozyma polyspora DSM 70294]
MSSVTTTTSDIITISERYTVIDGFLIYTEKNNGNVTRKIVDVNFRKGFLRDDERIELKKFDLINIDELRERNKHSEMIPCNSTELFNYCDTITRRYYWEYGNLILFTDRSKKEKEKDAERFTVIPLRKYNKATKYLYYKHIAADDDYSDYYSDDDDYFTPIINSGVVNFFKDVMEVYNMNICDNDLNILKDYTKSYYEIKKKSIDTFNEMYYHVRKNNPCITFIKTVLEPIDGEPFPETLTGSTLELYGTKFANFLYLIEVFPSLELSKNKIIPLYYTSDNLTTKISKIFYAIITGDEKYLEYLLLMIRLSCFDWNKPSEKLPPTLSFSEFQYTLDSLKCWVAYATLFRSVQLQNISSTIELFAYSTESKQSKPLCSIDNIYKLLVNEIAKIPDHTFRPLGAGKYLLVGQPFQKEYLVELYSDVKNLFDSRLKELRNYYKDLKDVSVVASMTIKSSKGAAFENRYHPKISITDLFNIDIQRSVVPTICFYNEEDHDKILNLIVDCLTCLMLMIYISSGSPYNFPEMRELKYASNNRNLFINPIDKTVEFIATYSKNKSNIPICKAVDELTSDYIIYAILVLSPIMRKHSHEMNYVMNRDILNEINSDSNLNPNLICFTPQQDLNDKEFTSQILESYLFVDPIRGSLIGYQKFEFLFNDYPSCQLRDLRFNFNNLRHAIIGIQRYELYVDDTGMRVGPAVVRLTGNSSLTHVQNYDVNLTGMKEYENTTEYIDGYLISKFWIKLLGLGYGI